MKWMADQYFGMIGDEFQGRDTPLGTYRPNLLERKDWRKENKLWKLSRCTEES
jgi:hypothetical protein